MAITSEHPFDERSKTHYVHYFYDKQIRADQQFEVFSRGRSIDIVTECTEENLITLKDTCFSHFRRVNSLEFKGPHDPLTASDLNLIISRIWGIAARDRVERKEAREDANFLNRQTIKEIAEFPSLRTVTIVCVTRPDKILDTPELKAEFNFKPSSEPGMYHSSTLGIPIWLIHPDELEVIPRNYPLLSLSRGKKLQQYIDLCLENGWESALHFIVDIALTLDPSDVFQSIMEVLHMKTKIRPETVLYFDQLLKDVPELIWQTSTLREAVEQGELLGEARGEARGKAHGEALGVARGEARGRQSTLIKLLRHKFTELPSSVTSLINETTDLELLEEWSIGILTANTLQELFHDEVVTTHT